MAFSMIPAGILLPPPHPHSPHTHTGHPPTGMHYSRHWATQPWTRHPLWVRGGQPGSRVLCIATHPTSIHSPEQSLGLSMSAECCLPRSFRSALWHSRCKTQPLGWFLTHLVITEGLRPCSLYHVEVGSSIQRFISLPQSCESMFFLLTRILAEVAHCIYEGEWGASIRWKAQNIKKQEDQMK